MRFRVSAQIRANARERRVKIALPLWGIVYNVPRATGHDDCSGSGKVMIRSYDLFCRMEKQTPAHNEQALRGGGGKNEVYFIFIL